VILANRIWALPPRAAAATHAHGSRWVLTPSHSNLDMGRLWPGSLFRW
jgi:hypothetical protein